MAKRFRFLIVLLLMVSIVAHGAPVIKYVGSSTIGKYIYEAKKKYTSAKITINTTSESSGGEIAASNGSADIGGVAREVDSGILKSGVKKFLIGKDALAVFVNPSNPVNNLSFEQLKAIFTGKEKNWSKFGGKNLPILIFIVNPKSATRKVFKNQVLDGEEYSGEATTIKPDTKLLSVIQKRAGAIGVLSLAFVLDKKNIKLINPNGEIPSLTNFKYPIFRPLHLVTNGDPKGSVKSFIDWTLSPAGQSLVRKYFIGAK